MADKAQRIKEGLKDPAKVENFCKFCWGVADKDKKGYISFDEFEQNCKALLNTTANPTAEGREKIRKLVDPQNTNKVTYEAFKKTVNIVIEELKKQGKL